jgi:hypothetical protein
MVSIGGIKIKAPNEYVNDVLGDLTGKNAQDAANAANEERYKQALALFDQGLPEVRTGFQQQRGMLARAVNTTRAGTNKALGEIAMMGARGRQAYTDQGQKALGQGSAALIQRGLGTSSALGGLARGVAADTARGVQSVNEGAAGARANVMQDEAARVAQIQSLIGGSYANEGSSLAQWRLSKINAILNRQDVAGPGLLQSIAGLAVPIIAAAK